MENRLYIFHRSPIITEDIFCDDVFNGVIYTYDNVNLVIVFDFSVEESITETWDPAIDEWDMV